MNMASQLRSLSFDLLKGTWSRNSLFSICEKVRKRQVRRVIDLVDEPEKAGGLPAIAPPGARGIDPAPRLPVIPFGTAGSAARELRLRLPL